MNVPELNEQLTRWLPRQRWFAGKGREFEVSLRELTALTAAPSQVTLWLADITYSNGQRDTYQLPLVARDEPDDGLQHVFICTTTDDGVTRFIYDALHDKDVTQAWLLGVRDQAKIGPVHFERHIEADAVPVGRTSIVLTGEQSNTSLVYGNEAILKVFRRLEFGVNPDIEVHAALGELGARHIARLLGAVSAEIDGQPVSLGMLQEFMTTATDGWELARASVRDLMAEADLHAAEAGGDFAGEAERLGTSTAEVHADLVLAFGSETLPAHENQVRASAMHVRLDAALGIVPALSEVEGGVRALFDAFGSVTSPLATQRVHGDLHLGQTLRTANRWVVLDFEGEPSSTIAARRRFDSPLRDVAGMLRSIDYAARYQLVGRTPSSQLEYRAIQWAERNRTAYLRGYTEASGVEPSDELAVLRAFEADKAVYEAVYEARNRPDWLPIPLSSLSRLVRAGEQEGS